MSQSLAGILGGTPSAVALRLLVVSFLVGIVLTTMGFEPETLYENCLRLIRHLFSYGLDDVKQIGRILLTGAMVVAPIWIVLRVLNARGK
jgi:Family of unknown function (DUF6460)